ncbi:MAG TPA: DUF6131 family protein [Streptosporangiaceae bacterium]|nr:DUF6131 family protein [Streptosporangiaceae bacterium]
MIRVDLSTRECDVVVAGLILMLLGMAGHAVGGRRHYY